MTLFLLDTNIISDAIRNTRGTCAARIASIDPTTLCTSIIVAAELRFGAAKKGSTALNERVRQALAGLRVLPLDGDADVRYGTLRAALESSGQVIGANDMLIAAHALSLDAVLVTDNVGEFARVKGLRCENWLNPL
ncbi:Ribonuclease VapC [Cupriavidus taiwanensis]|uniref:Ribonuclease VapC n=1 Tax=Cupriavidus taiwanensis TaxID=164546 RepID=A0A375E8M1_9BURK|nr:type II toxin-antitoxin system VapC family toxin [Cupriavidus taiwanensis]SOZ18386.1 Ribonuclease VapC [Cupriavidus taiwanensis]SOZ31459.1 Ribonuclease VapC [Cupriavidus taiwanensis]SOZ47421.1 Ribonuclease VapC [Cupriavidus taiwanensis]SOZ67271.1 Ribonuclease VapC [Cupriavidus taiwanensis]SOZ68498.1 Ribonuclease VapC [Cupriavidus taiwanensis]